jgi:hypothetical protein
LLEGVDQPLVIERDQDATSPAVNGEAVALHPESPGDYVARIREESTRRTAAPQA